MELFQIVKAVLGILTDIPGHKLLQKVMSYKGLA
jgi:hypothetical protein